MNPSTKLNANTSVPNEASEETKATSSSLVQSTEPGKLSHSATEIKSVRLGTKGEQRADSSSLNEVNKSGGFKPTQSTRVTASLSSRTSREKDTHFRYQIQAYKSGRNTKPIGVMTSSPFPVLESADKFTQLARGTTPNSLGTDSDQGTNSSSLGQAHEQLGNLSLSNQARLPESSALPFGAAVAIGASGSLLIIAALVLTYRAHQRRKWGWQKKNSTAASIFALKSLESQHQSSNYTDLIGKISTRQPLHAYSENNSTKNGSSIADITNDSQPGKTDNNDQGFNPFTAKKYGEGTSVSKWADVINSSHYLMPRYANDLNQHLVQDSAAIERICEIYLSNDSEMSDDEPVYHYVKTWPGFKHFDKIVLQGELDAYGYMSCATADFTNKEIAQRSKSTSSHSVDGKNGVNSVAVSSELTETSLTGPIKPTRREVQNSLSKTETGMAAPPLLIEPNPKECEQYFGLSEKEAARLGIDMHTDINFSGRADSSSATSSVSILRTGNDANLKLEPKKLLREDLKKRSISCDNHCSPLQKPLRPSRGGVISSGGIYCSASADNISSIAVGIARKELTGKKGKVKVCTSEAQT